MTEVERYVRTLILRVTHHLSIPTGFLRREQVSDALIKQVRQLLKQHGAAQLIDVQAFVAKLIDELIAEKILVDESHDIAGTYYVHHKERFTFFQQRALTRNDIADAADKIGNRFFSDVFAAFAKDKDAATRSFPALGLPTSYGRVVRFAPEQVRPLVDALGKLVGAAGEDPRLAENAELRALVTGQLEAGARLLAGEVVRLHLLQSTLGEALRFLAGASEKSNVATLSASLNASLSNHSIISG